ncbi:MAG: threonylcarbamoyl-AMP synthase [Verrucomicrobiales bacterium]|nr:threonylcarbamoyl-AMP synthase [Verrucomicrobiales bacterium]
MAFGFWRYAGGVIAEPTPENLRRAVALLRAGQCVGLPTETVYGLAGDALNPAALAAIFASKNRPRFDPLILHVAEGFALEKIAAEIPPVALTLMARFWPGPLTLLFAKRELVPDLATAGLPTVAVRCPAHPVAQALLREFGGPLAAPSANKFGRISPTTAAAVADELGDAVPLILDGGPCRVGVESTILNVSGGAVTLLRPGGIALEEVTAVIGSVGRPADGAVTAPGMLKSHYAPRAPLERLAAPWPVGRALPANVALLAWRGFAGADGERRRVRVLAADGELSLAAARLFQCLRELDALGMEKIFAEPVPARGLGLAINDRLERASAFGI